jgi:hypothetical protein
VSGEYPEHLLHREPVSTTTPEDRERFFGQSDTGRVHVIEAGWPDRVRTCRLHAYRLPAGQFRPCCIRPPLGRVD